MMIDLINEKGGVLGKHKIVQVDGDSQSKTEAAINEAERLLNVEKVDILAGVYSSAHAVPLAEKVDKQKKFLWITTAISDAVVKDRNLEYTFRPQANSGLFGVASVQYVAGNARRSSRKRPRTSGSRSSTKTGRTASAWRARTRPRPSARACRSC